MTLGFERGRIDAQIGHQAKGFLAVGERRFNCPRSAIRQHQFSAGAKFVALGVAAKIVVIIENKNSREWIFCAVEIGCRQATKAPAYNYKIVAFISNDGRSRSLPEFSIAQIVGNFESSIVTTTHPGQRGRVISRSVLSQIGLVSGGSKSGNEGACYHATYANSHSVQEVSAGDGSIHAQLAITSGIAVVLLHDGPGLIKNDLAESVSRER